MVTYVPHSHQTRLSKFTTHGTTWVMGRLLITVTLTEIRDSDTMTTEMAKMPIEK